MTATNSVFPSFSGISWPVKRIPIFNTRVAKSMSGAETRISFMAYPLYKIDIQFDYLSLSDYQTLGAFFKARKGKLDSFLFDDPSENSVTALQIGVGNGTNKNFQLLRSVGGYTEPVENPKSSPSIYINGSLQSSGYSISSTGICIFSTAPTSGAVITWTGGYYYRVRFDVDEIEFAENFKSFFELKKLTLYGATGNKV